MLSPIVHEIAEEYADTLKVGKVNVDEQAALAQRYRVSSIPTLIVFEHGREVRRTVGVQGKEALEELLFG